MHSVTLVTCKSKKLYAGNHSEAHIKFRNGGVPCWCFNEKSNIALPIYLCFDQEINTVPFDLLLFWPELCSYYPSLSGDILTINPDYTKFYAAVLVILSQTVAMLVCHFWLVSNLFRKFHIPTHSWYCRYVLANNSVMQAINQWFLDYMTSALVW